MDNFNLRKYLAEGKLHEEFDNYPKWDTFGVTTDTDPQGTWVVFSDPEDPYLEEEGWSFAVEKKQIEQVANGKREGVEDGSSISHSMTAEEAKSILAKM